MTIRWTTTKDSTWGRETHHGIGEFAEYRIELDRPSGRWHVRRLLDARKPPLSGSFGNVENAKAYCEHVERGGRS